MVLGFLHLAVGVITVRFLKKRMWWFRIHKMLGIIAMFIMISGGISAYLMVRFSGEGHLEVPHTWFGVATILVVIITPAAGFLQLRVRKKIRMRLIHRTAGWTAACLSLISMVSGGILMGIIPTI